MDCAGWVENVVDSSRFDRIDTNRFSHCRFDMSEVDLREPRLRVNRVDSQRASHESTEVCCHVLRNEEGSCIIISRILTSGSANRRRARRVESTRFGCIGHGCLSA